MEKTINAFEIRRTFGKVLQDVLGKGDRFVVERHGEPVAVVVPVSVYEQWKKSRERFFETLAQAQQNANLSESEADAAVQEAIKTIRVQ